MGNEEKKSYVLRDVYGRDGSGHATTKMKIDEGVEAVQDGQPVLLSDEQYQKASQFARFELVEKPSEVLDLVDQPFVDRPSSSTAEPPELGTTPNLDKSSPSELKRLAKEAGIQGYTTKSDSELRKALEDHYAPKEG